MGWLGADTIQPIATGLVWWMSTHRAPATQPGTRSHLQGESRCVTQTCTLHPDSVDTLHPAHNTGWGWQYTPALVACPLWVLGRPFPGGLWGLQPWGPLTPSLVPPSISLVHSLPEPDSYPLLGLRSPLTAPAQVYSWGCLHSGLHNRLLKPAP